MAAQVPSLDVDSAAVRADVPPLKQPAADVPGEVAAAARQSSTDAFRLAMLIAALLCASGAAVNWVGIVDPKRPPPPRPRPRPRPAAAAMVSTERRTPFSDPGLFGPGSMAWRVDGEMLVLAGGSCALLMQLAHPAVAAGVDQHSDFRADPFARLRRTLTSSYAVAFGTASEAEAAIRRVNAIHAVVRGTRRRDRARPITRPTRGCCSGSTPRWSTPRCASTTAT